MAAESWVRKQYESEVDQAISAVISHDDPMYTILSIARSDDHEEVSIDVALRFRQDKRAVKGLLGDYSKSLVCWNLRRSILDLMSDHVRLRGVRVSINIVTCKMIVLKNKLCIFDGNVVAHDKSYASLR